MPTYNVGAAETYTTISAAVAAIPADLSATGIHEVIIETGTYTETVSILSLANGGAFINESASDFIRLRAKDGDEHLGSFTSGVQIDGSIYGQLSFSEFKQLVVRSPSAIYCFHFGGVTADILAESCLAKRSGGTNPAGFIGGSSTGTVTHIKCVAWNSGYHGNNNYSGFQYGQPSGPLVFRNCVSHGFFYGFRHGSYGENKPTFYNCVVGYSFSFAFFVIDGRVLGSNNAARSSIPFGSDNLINMTEGQQAFIDITNGDFHVNTYSALLEAGIEQSAYFTTDIDGDAIPLTQWPIGIDYEKIPSCWTYTARYKNSKRLFRLDGPGVYPSKLRVPSNVDASTGQMVDEGRLIDPSKYSIN